MEPQNEKTPLEQLPRVDEPRPPKKRFQVEKLEERIAPKKYNSGASGSDAYGSSASIY